MIFFCNFRCILILLTNVYMNFLQTICKLYKENLPSFYCFLYRQFWEQGRANECCVSLHLIRWRVIIPHIFRLSSTQTTPAIKVQRESKHWLSECKIPMVRIRAWWRLINDVSSYSIEYNLFIIRCRCIESHAVKV